MSEDVLPDVLPEPTMRRLEDMADVCADRVVLSFSAPPIQAALARTDVLITGWGAPLVTRDVLAAAPRLRRVVHAAGSVKSVVSPEVLAAGVRVTTAAGANAIPVAEFTVASIVLSLKRAFRLNGHYATHPRRDLATVPAMGTFGVTVGVVGASRIGRLVIERLRVHGMQVLLSDPHVTSAEATRLGATAVPLDVLFEASDVVTLHAPALPETRHLVDARRLALLRDGAVLVNTARGSLVDLTALVPHVRSGRLDAVLDVTEPEPLPSGSELYGLPNVVLTPHIAGALGNERARIGEAAVREVERFALGLEPADEVVLADFARIA